MSDTPPLSRAIAVDDIAAAGTAVEVVATEAECRALAAHNGLPGIDSLRAKLLLRPEGRADVRVTGELEAAVVQTCVVSLEPFPAAVREAIDVRFAPPEVVDAVRATRRGDGEESDDDPDPIEHGRIDVGALVAEHLTLGLDPYPHKPGAALSGAASGPDERVSPFAVLRDRGKPSS